MIICNETCQLYNRCDCKDLRQRCVFDTSVNEKEDDKDAFLERLTY